ncbi:hypothetical protein ABBQ32_010170 [Trebouxia sp. C0010 RCD-2024]
MATDSVPNQLYNKQEHRHTLVGNWQEEQKLLETTGEHRYKAWTYHDPAPNSGSTVYASRQDKPEQLPTFERVFAHDEKLDSKDWRTQSQATYRSKEQCASDPALYTQHASAGIRTQLELRAMLAEAAVEQDTAVLPPQYQTNYREEYQYSGLHPGPLGRRVMKNQNGSYDVQRDATFLAESGMLPKAQADRLASSSFTLGQAYTNRDRDVPVSIYSEAALQGLYGSTVYGSRITGPATFARNSDFSKPLSEYSKIMDADCVPMAAEA